MTMIAQINKEQSFGEVSFFSEKKRSCTARSSDYTDVFVIRLEDFLQLAYEFTEAISLYHTIHDQVNSSKDYSNLFITCYICNRVGHLSTDCTYFPQISGNLKKKNRDIKKKKQSQLIVSIKEEEKKNYSEEQNLSTEGGNAFYNRRNPEAPHCTVNAHTKTESSFVTDYSGELTSNLEEYNHQITLNAGEEAQNYMLYREGSY